MVQEVALCFTDHNSSQGFVCNYLKKKIKIIIKTTHTYSNRRSNRTEKNSFEFFLLNFVLSLFHSVPQHFRSLSGPFAATAIKHINKYACI